MSHYEKLKECINELSDLKKLESASGIPEKDVLFNEIVLNYLIYDNDWFSLDKCGGVISPVKGTFIKDFFRYFTAARGVKFKLFVASVFLNLHWLYKIGLNIFSGKEKKHSGRRFVCPCCDNRFSEFTDFDFADVRYNPVLYADFYKNTVCPVCQSLPRHRILAYFMETHTQMFHNKKILVTGMSPQEYILFKRLNIKVENTDVYDGANYKWDLQNIPCTEEQYDVIISNHVLEHIKDYKKAINELFRILKKGGVLLITVPLLYRYQETFEDFCAESAVKRKLYYGQSDHLRIFGKNFPEYLKSAGFEVEVLDGRKMPRNIRPVTGPAAYDDKIIYLAKK